MKIPTPQVKRGLAIIGPYGNIWTDAVFDTPKQAAEYIKRAWPAEYVIDWTQWRAVPATITVAADVQTQPVESLPLTGDE